jgi:ligand-binding SRPBCC domain-containing protein
METIRLQTWVNAPMERCFKLSLSIDLHVLSADSTKEKVVSRVKSGLLGLDDAVTWSGRHFGLRFRHTSVIDACRPNMYFRDVMVEGMFEHFTHEHHFAVMDDGTRMRDEVRFSAPWGVLGQAAEKLVLRRHLIQLLKRRNAVIKRVAESGEWQRFLSAEVSAGRGTTLEFQRSRVARG